ncbi:hypothetical protein QUB33_22135 [Microcoleus sp. B3-A4]|uniref:hypothetical protein n=1 Tax=Microcoleus sp. B3-A4 TaxID=2818653 RepID=UPI002FD45001
MVEVKLSLEGEDVDVAAEQLFETTGLQGNWEVAKGSIPTKEGTGASQFCSQYKYSKT